METVVRQPGGNAGTESSPARERIVQATLDLISEAGIGALSNRLIAQRAGVSLGSLTYHFTSQTSLLRESLLLYVGGEVARIGAIADDLRNRDPVPPPREIAAVVQGAIAEGLRRSEPLAEMELHLQAARDPELREASRRCFVAYQELATTALAALDVPDPSRHARTAVAVMYGMSLEQMGTARHDAAAMTAALTTIVRGAFAEGAAPAPR